MSTSLLTAIAYDVTDDRRRQRLRNLLLLYGVPIQHSVFEARLTSGERDALVRRAGEILNPAEDRLVMYPLGSEAEARVLWIGPERPRCEIPGFFIV